MKNSNNIELFFGFKIDTCVDVFFEWDDFFNLLFGHLVSSRKYVFDKVLQGQSVLTW